VKILVVRTGALFGADETSHYAPDLCQALSEAGHEAEAITIPFSPAIAGVISQTAAYRLFDLRGSGELCIALGPFSWAVRHENKRVWLFSRYRPLHGHWNTPYGAVTTSHTNVILRDVVRRLDVECMAEAKMVFAASNSVVEALRSTGIHSTLLQPPIASCLLSPPAEVTRGRFVLAVGRIKDEARLDLLLSAFCETRSAQARLVVTGHRDTTEELEYISALIAECARGNLIELEINPTIPSIRSRIASCLAVVSLPFADECASPYALAAARLGKDVLTTEDSGELARIAPSDRVVAPEPAAIAHAMDHWFENPDAVERSGARLSKQVTKMLPSWSDVVAELTR